MFFHLIYISHIFEILYFYKKTTIMGQFLDYLASVFTSKSSNELTNKKSSSTNHVTFADNSFTQAFTKNDSEKAAKIASVTFSNRRTINIYQTIAFVAFLAHLLTVVVPTIQSETFDILDTHTYQQLTLACIPPVIYFAAISAMCQVHKPLSEGAKLSSKNSGLDLSSNRFIFSLKVVTLLTALCQITSIYFDKILWSMVIIVSISND